MDIILTFRFFRIYQHILSQDILDVPDSVRQFWLTDIKSSSLQHIFNHLTALRTKNLQSIKDIQSIFIKTGEKLNGKLSKVYHRDIFGLRQYKYDTLDTLSIEDSSLWKELTLEAPYYFFVPKDFSLRNEYEKGFAFTDLFINNVSGIKTSKDELNVRNSENEVQMIINDALTLKEEEFRNKWNTGNDSRDWSVARAIADVKENYDKLIISPYNYRPFDIKFIAYTGKTNGIVAWPRYHSLRAMLCTQNFAFCTIRINRD